MISDVFQCRCRSANSNSNPLSGINLSGTIFAHSAQKRYTKLNLKDACHLPSEGQTTWRVNSRVEDSCCLGSLIMTS